ncbi:MAG: CRISPR-associated endonuclease Cas2 [Bacteroidota bacterium]
MSKVIIVCYDISNNKVRTQFSKFLEKYGVRVQFSVFEIQNSKRVLSIVKNGIESRFKRKFDQSDSIYIFTTNHDKTIRYGSASLLDDDLILL